MGSGRIMYAVLSDIHGNLHALKEVVKDMEQYDVEGVILLGDLIDYGMQSNEVVEYIKRSIQNRVLCNIWGNHERAILTPDYDHFSSQRGVDSARHTAEKLSDETKEYLNNELNHEGLCEFELKGKRILAVHGSLEDRYWKAVLPDNVRGDYRKYDYVLSGHSHYSHCFTVFYETDDPVRRNKRAVTFVNPGAVGQPRNHNPNAQYVLLDLESGSVHLKAVKYDVRAAMELFDGSVDDFYRTRLETGV